MTDNSMVLKSQPAMTAPRGIPGRLFAVAFIGLLAVLCFLMISVAIRFQSIMASLEESRSLWPQASQELRPRYERIELSTMSDAVRSDWEKCKNEFDSSTLFDRQSHSAFELETKLILATKAANQAELGAIDANSQSVAKLIESEKRRRDKQAGFIGWLTVSALRLRLPAIFDPLSIKR